ncbi:protein FATTY ACID EXPORT 5-like [Andrographis paniculata]|uniref:protein FATTY ACID EXPORT 5-like n=1 Tax=Andrographis paniculata TaxID=175694 RepID=UPI0021E867A9|nr:protein FATTY ACID EXPORT 5-like [Andrographis paniculata]
MNDYYLTFPYGILLVCGGLIGYARKRSTPSLIGGLATGLLLLLAAYLSLQAYNKQTNSYIALILQTVIAAILTWIMGNRYFQTRKIMPAGIVAGISAVMTLFYIYKIASGGNHVALKAAE